MQMVRKTPKKNALSLAALGFFIGLIPFPANATKTVTSPTVEKGKLGLEWKGGYDIDDDDAVDGGWQQKTNINYGVTSFWATEAEANFRKTGASNADTETTSIAWKNKFQFLKQDENWLDGGVRVTTDFSTRGRADNLEVKLLLGKDVGKFRHTTNLIVEREFGEDSTDDKGVGFSWNSRYRWKPEFEPGIEIYSDFGPLNDGSSFDEESHQIGPVAYGKIGSFKYDVGYLFGVSDAAQDGQIKAILKYDWKF
jgi:hypothetical protein